MNDTIIKLIKNKVLFDENVNLNTIISYSTILYHIIVDNQHVINVV